MFETNANGLIIPTPKCPKCGNVVTIHLMKMWKVHPPILNLKSGARAKTFTTIQWKCGHCGKPFRTYLK